MPSSRSDAERRLPLRGTYNLREVGGYASASGGWIGDRLLWRGDALHAIDAEGRAALRDLPLRTVVDLRDEHERERNPNRLEGVGAEVIEIPMGVGAIAGEPGADVATWRRGELSGFFVFLTDTRGPQIAAAVSALTRPRALPALVHCTAGKDRTGLVIGLTLSALGVSDADVIADFALSASYLDAVFVAHARSAMLGAVRATDQTSDRVFLAAEPEWMLATLAHVREQHGDVASYLAYHGVDPGALAGLRDLLVSASEPAGGADGI